MMQDLWNDLDSAFDLTDRFEELEMKLKYMGGCAMLQVATVCLAGFLCRFSNSLTFASSSPTFIRLFALEPLRTSYPSTTESLTHARASR